MSERAGPVVSDTARLEHDSPGNSVDRRSETMFTEDMTTTHAHHEMTEDNTRHLAAHLLDQHRDDVSAMDYSLAEMIEVHHDLHADEAREEKYGLIGRDDVLVEKLAKTLLAEAKRHHDYSAIYQLANRRGYYFEVSIEPAGEHSRHVVRVSVELDRVQETR